MAKPWPERPVSEANKSGKQRVTLAVLLNLRMFSAALRPGQHTCAQGPAQGARLAWASQPRVELPEGMGAYAASTGTATWLMT